jgi:hypothetical protein
VSFLLWRAPIKNNPRQAAPTFFGTILLVIVIGVVSSCTVQQPGTVPNLRCTVVLQTDRATVLEKGEVVINMQDIETLDCYRVWVSPGE